MSRLVWSQVDDRRYTYGLDRGVFYPNEGQGVAWPGLVSFTETYAGGDTVPVYFDGIKRYEKVLSVEFQGQLQAYSKPKEFGPCDGERSLVPGFIITRQMRETFGFSYRTKTNDGYKIGLVWNATATKSQVDNTTISDTAEPIVFDWQISAVPPPAAQGYRPSAHFVIDSTNHDPSVMSQLLDVLYGTENSGPRLPSQVEIIQLLSVFDALDGGAPASIFTSEIDGGVPNAPNFDTLDGGTA